MLLFPCVKDNVRLSTNIQSLFRQKNTTQRKSAHHATDNAMRPLGSAKPAPFRDAHDEPVASHHIISQHGTAWNGTAWHKQTQARTVPRSAPHFYALTSTLFTVACQKATQETTDRALGQRAHVKYTRIQPSRKPTPRITAQNPFATAKPISHYFQVISIDKRGCSSTEV